LIEISAYVPFIHERTMTNDWFDHVEKENSRPLQGKKSNASFVCRNSPFENQIRFLQIFDFNLARF